MSSDCPFHCRKTKQQEDVVKKKLSAIRKEYHYSSLSEESISKDPFTQLDLWLNEAIAAGLTTPNAMILATAWQKGQSLGKSCTS